MSEGELKRRIRKANYSSTANGWDYDNICDILDEAQRDLFKEAGTFKLDELTVTFDWIPWFKKWFVGAIETK